MGRGHRRRRCGVTTSTLLSSYAIATSVRQVDGASINNNPDHRVEIIPGEPLDLHDGLDSVAIGKPASEPKPGKKPPKASEPGPTMPRRRDGGSPYGLSAMSGECEAVRTARYGQQEQTLNAAALKIGALVAGGELDEGLALGELLAAGRSMASQPGKRPWNDKDIDHKVQHGFRDGMRQPRTAKPNGQSNGHDAGHRPLPHTEPARKASDTEQAQPDTEPAPGPAPEQVTAREARPDLGKPSDTRWRKS